MNPELNFSLSLSFKRSNDVVGMYLLCEKTIYCLSRSNISLHMYFYCNIHLSIAHIHSFKKSSSLEPKIMKEREKFLYLSQVTTTQVTYIWLMTGNEEGIFKGVFPTIIIRIFSFMIHSLIHSFHSYSFRRILDFNSLQFIMMRIEWSREFFSRINLNFCYFCLQPNNYIAM